ncbi:hypothetical protein ACP275_11G073000 [Erythranthe tilingii]
MGRRKLEMKQIENNSARMVCFSKRRSDLIKKAKELFVLCNVDVAAIIFSKSGKLYQYCSTYRSLCTMINDEEKIDHKSVNVHYSDIRLSTTTWNRYCDQLFD